jgi:hypothetical protein
LSSSWLRACLAPFAAAFAIIAFIAFIAFPREARADFDFQFATGLNGGWIRKTPALATPPLLTNARELGSGSIPMRGGLATVGPYLDIALTLDDRWSIPLLGGAGYWSVGSYDAVVTSYEGSIVNVRPWSAFRGDLLLPGLGRRFKHRRYMWGAAMRMGLSYLSMGGSLADGAESVPLDLSATTFLVQAELEACRRLDPTTRVCLHVAPHVYDFSLLNGLTFGFRAEWGR